MMSKIEPPDMPFTAEQMWWLLRTLVESDINTGFDDPELGSLVQRTVDVYSRGVERGPGPVFVQTYNACCGSYFDIEVCGVSVRSHDELGSDETTPKHMCWYVLNEGEDERLLKFWYATMQQRLVMAR